MFSEKQARNVQGTLQVKIAGPFTSVHLIEILNFQYSTCLIQLQPYSNLTSQAFQENSHPEIRKTLGGRLIHRIDLYTGKYGKCTIPSMDCLTPGDAHKSCKLFKQIILCCL